MTGAVWREAVDLSTPFAAKPSVVGGHDNGPGIGSDGSFQLSDQHQAEVIRWLVQEQDVGRVGQHRGKFQAATLSHESIPTSRW